MGRSGDTWSLIGAGFSKGELGRDKVLKFQRRLSHRRVSSRRVSRRREFHRWASNREHNMKTLIFIRGETWFSGCHELVNTRVAEMGESFAGQATSLEFSRSRSGCVVLGLGILD